MARTFQLDADRPKLPLPELADTLAKLVQLLKPYCTADERENLDKELDRLLNGNGNDVEALRKAQAMLKARWQEKDHYCLDWWNETYLDHRGPLIPSESMIPHYPTTGDQVETAANVVFAATSVLETLLRQELPPRTSHSHTLTMVQYRNLFQTYRLPGATQDQTLNRFQTFEEQGSISKNNLGSVLVSCNANFFVLQLSSAAGDDEKFRRLTLDELKSCISHIYSVASSSSVPKDQQVGALTAGPRLNWFKAREVLQQSSRNREMLEQIEQCAFAVHLDRECPKDPETRLKESAIGTHIGTRWFDCGMQFVVFGNGEVSYIMEHSSLDALPAFWVQEEMFKSMSETMQDKKQALVDASFASAHVSQLRWHGLESVTPYIQESFRVHQEIWETWSVRVKRLHGVGRTLVKSTGLSPDSFLQVAFQLAFVRLFGFVPSVYESVVTTRFRKSRTETGRSVTSSTCAFLDAADQAHLDKQHKRELLIQAVNSHAMSISESRVGKGVDRHLFAIRRVAESEGLTLPNLLSAENDLFCKASSWDLSTSHVTSPLCAARAEHGTAFHPVGMDSIGIVYGIYPDWIDFTIMTDLRSNRVNGDEYLDEVFRAVFDLVDLVLPRSVL